MGKIIKAVDLFCGAGGTSSGLIKACEKLGYKVDLTAINHWDIALQTHSANHVTARHLCESLDNVNPRELFPEGRIDLLVASPECTHHSRARGGKPMNDQSRSSAWTILRFLEAIYVDNVLIENVREFKDWGPLGADGLPLKSKKGETFKVFIAAIESLGYRVDYRVVNAANYGDPTTRERLFIMARRGNKKVVWPEFTHTKDGEMTLFGPKKKWVPAKDIIDWNYPSQSIFTRKKPLSQNTIRRIIRGLEKFNGDVLRPFLDMMYDLNNGKSINIPVAGIPTDGEHIKFCEPFIVNAKGKSNALSINMPMPTQTTNYHQYLCEPFIVRTDHTGSNGGCIYDIESPVRTITSKQHFALCQPFLVSYYGNGDAHSIENPIGTITTKDRYALVQPEINGYKLDIFYRMMQPHELAEGMSFDKSYKFYGTKTDIVKQIGNAVPRRAATAHCYTLLAA